MGHLEAEGAVGACGRGGGFGLGGGRNRRAGQAYARSRCILNGAVYRGGVGGGGGVFTAASGGGSTGTSGWGAAGGGAGGEKQGRCECREERPDYLESMIKRLLLSERVIAGSSKRFDCTCSITRWA